MNVMLIGNGFDIYHKLPTKYENFLHTVSFLQNNYNDRIKTIADVFSNEKLQQEDAFIKECYNVQKQRYVQTHINQGKLKKLINKAENNFWFKYLSSTFDKDVGWIDFEKEIAYVLNTFSSILTDITVNVYLSQLKTSQSFILRKFNFFLQKYDEVLLGAPSYTVLDEYTKEYPFGSGVIVVNNEKIINKLCEQLHELAQMLKLYLEIFVESILINLSIERCPLIKYMDFTISFNYTHTCSKLYPKHKIFYIHGELDKKIILGINPDGNDKKESIDVSFVKFKKYFQRVQFDTDKPYLNWVQDLGGYGDIYLTIFGHSLDKTDEDLIVELFKKSTVITILYHDEEAKQRYICNLISIFGKEEFQEIRENKELNFISLNDNLKSFEEKLSDNQLSFL